MRSESDDELRARAIEAWRTWHRSQGYDVDELWARSVGLPRSNALALATTTGAALDAAARVYDVERRVSQPVSNADELPATSPRAREAAPSWLTLGARVRVREGQRSQFWEGVVDRLGSNDVGELWGVSWTENGGTSRSYFTAEELAARYEPVNSDDEDERDTPASRLPARIADDATVTLEVVASKCTGCKLGGDQVVIRVDCPAHATLVGAAPVVHPGDAISVDADGTAYVNGQRVGKVMGTSDGAVHVHLDGKVPERLTTTIGFTPDASEVRAANRALTHELARHENAPAWARGYETRRQARTPVVSPLWLRYLAAADERASACASPVRLSRAALLEVSERDCTTRATR